MDTRPRELTKQIDWRVIPVPPLIEMAGWAEATGYPRYTPGMILPLVHPDDVAKFEPVHATLLGRRPDLERVTTSYRIRCADGQYRRFFVDGKRDPDTLAWQGCMTRTPEEIAERADWIERTIQFGTAAIAAAALLGMNLG